MFLADPGSPVARLEGFMRSKKGNLPMGTPPRKESSRKDASGVKNLVREVRSSFGIPRKTFARLTGYSERSLAAWEQGKALKETVRKVITELARLQKELAKVIDPAYLKHWLETPADAFGGLKPLEVIERGQVDRIWKMIYDLSSGSAAAPNDQPHAAQKQASPGKEDNLRE